MLGEQLEDLSQKKEAEVLRDGQRLLLLELLTERKMTKLTQDFHGWGGTAHDQMVHMPWRDLADTDSVPFLLVTMDGMNDVDHGHWSSWNVSASEVTLPSPLISSDITVF